MVAAMISMFPSVNCGMRLADVTALSSSFTPSLSAIAFTKSDIVPDYLPGLFINVTKRRKRVFYARDKDPLLLHFSQGVLRSQNRPAKYTDERHHQTNDASVFICLAPSLRRSKNSN